MGGAKERLLQEQEQGWTFQPNSYVCDRCMQDDSLKDLVKSNALDCGCSFCGRKSKRKIAAPMDVVLQAVNEALNSEYMDPIDILPYESAEGGYQGNCFDTYDLLWDLEAFEREDLVSAVHHAFGGKLWCSRDYQLLQEHKRLSYGWRDFCDLVKHKTRYMFFNEVEKDWIDRDPETVHPTEILDAIGSIATDLNRIVKHAAGEIWTRARLHSGDKFGQTAVDLGSPPLNKTQANRMSPHGISMFYGSRNDETCRAELGEPRLKATYGYFTTLRQLNLLDLVDIPSVPTIFDAVRRHQRQSLQFLHGFVRDLAAPVRRDGMEYTEYVPTQIVTEYFRHRYNHDGEAVHGILYPSSQIANGINVVLFCDNQLCCDESSLSDGKWLSLTKSRIE